MSTYHINPETKRPNVCRDEAGCKVATKKGHFATAEEAKLSLKAPAAKKAAPKSTAKPKATTKAAPKPKVVEPEPAPTVESLLGEVENTVAEPVVEAPVESDSKEADELLSALIPGIFEDAKPAEEEKKALPTVDEVKDFVEEKFEIVKGKTVEVANSPVVVKTIENVKKDAAVVFSTVSAWGKQGLGKLKETLKQKKD